MEETQRILSKAEYEHDHHHRKFLKKMSIIPSKKICIISPSLKMGGIERALTVLANYFSRLEYSVSFVSAQGGEKFYELDKNIAFYEPNLKRKKGIVGKIHVYYKIISFISKTVTIIKPDVVLSFGDAFNPLVLFCSEK